MAEQKIKLSVIIPVYNAEKYIVECLDSIYNQNLNNDEFEVIIVNEARGAVVNEADISNALKNGQIAGFGTDVYSKEPFDTDHPFYDIKEMKNVILTPHAAWGAYEARCRCLSIVCDNIEAFLNRKILNRVDK